jgi:hypothetical protein
MRRLRKAASKAAGRVHVDWSETSTYTGLIWLSAGLGIFFGIKAEWSEWIGIAQALVDGQALNNHQCAIIGAAASTAVGTIRTLFRDKLASG